MITNPFPKLLFTRSLLSFQRILRFEEASTLGVPEPRRFKTIRLMLISFFIYSALAIYITYPLIFHMDDMATELVDQLLIAWIHNWVIHSLSTNPLSLFDANIYYPFHNTLAYSDLFITSSLLAFIPLKFIGQPITANNFTLISSLIFLGFSLFLLTFYLTRDYFASLLSGILVILSPAVLSNYIHIQMLAIQWVPLSILFFLIFIKLKKSKYLALSLFFFILQAYNSFLPGYFIAFSFIIIFTYNFLHNKKKTRELITKKNFLIIFITFILIIPITIPYYSVSKEFNYVRDIRESIHNALQPEDLLYSSGFSRLHNLLNSLPFNRISQNNEFKPGFLGFIFSFLTIFALYYFVKNFKNNDKFLTSFITIGLVGLILSLGPALHLGRQTIHKPFPIPLPYALFYYILPGFQGFRNSARWEMLFILSMSVTIAIVLHKVFKKKSLKTRSIIYTFLILGTIIEFNFPMHFMKIPQVGEFPKVYSWLATTPPDTRIIEMPIYTWNMPYVSSDNMREYYSTIHFRKMVNGASGFSPPPWQELVVEIIKEFPSQKTIVKLRQMKINYIIIHKSEYDKIYKDNFTIKKHRIPSGQNIIKKLSENNEVKLIKHIENDYVYQL